MAEYIERKKLLDELQEEIDFETTMYTEEQNKYFNMGLKCAIRDVKSQPIVDVVKVTRCKDCKHSDFYCENYRCENSEAPWFDNEFANIMQPNDFCSYGELKEREGNE